MSPDRTGEEIAELKARIEELEQQVDGQQSGGGLSMSRRGVLGSLVGVGAAGAALGSLSEPASAQSSPVGQLGSDSDRIDLYGSTVDTEALEAGEDGVTVSGDKKAPLNARANHKGLALSLQTHDNDGSNADRKAKIWTFDKTGDHRLSEITMGEVIDDNTMEMSFYVSDSPPSESSGTTNKVLDLHGGDRKPEALWYGLEYFRIQGTDKDGQSTNGRLELQPGDDTSDAEIRFLDNNSINQFQLYYDGDSDLLKLLHRNSGQVLFEIDNPDTDPEARLPNGVHMKGSQIKGQKTGTPYDEDTVEGYIQTSNENDEFVYIPYYE